MNIRNQGNATMSSNRLLAALGAAMILAASGLTTSVTIALASPYDRQVTQGDLQPERVCSPYAGRDYTDQVLFGDTRFHTNLSFDAGLIGTRLTMDEGYRLARGEKVVSNTGQPVQLIRPLDFFGDYRPRRIYRPGTDDPAVGSEASGGSLGEMGARAI